MTAATLLEKRVLCPACGKAGRRVSLVTLRALLMDAQGIPIAFGEDRSCDSAAGNSSGCKPVTEGSGYRFCDSPNCDVVYFAEESDVTFTTTGLRVRVGVKETTGERPMCYCFGHSIASIKDELHTKGRSDALEDIRAKMKHPGCHCETENPSGACCLGSVAKGITTAQEELNMTESNVPMNTTSSPSASGRGELIAKVGVLISAVMASACCWLPLVLLAVGVSGAGIASALEVYRPLLIVITFAFLGAAFYFTYRPRKATACATHACCATEPTDAEECCAPSTQRRFNLMAFNKVMLWVVTVLAVAFLFFPSYVGRLVGSGAGPAVTANMNQTVFRVEGMTCEGCAAIAEKAIRGVPGVLAVHVDHEKGDAVVGTDVGSPVPQDQILAALKKAGYKGVFSASKE